VRSGSVEGRGKKNGWVNYADRITPGDVSKTSSGRRQGQVTIVVVVMVVVIVVVVVMWGD